MRALLISLSKIALQDRTRIMMGGIERFVVYPINSLHYLVKPPVYSQLVNLSLHSVFNILDL
jgi:hypothetical protein